jgi:hypothetical protein
MKNNKSKAIKALSWINGKLNEKGFGVEHVAKPTGGGGSTHYNELKFGKMGKVNIPNGKVSYAKPTTIQIKVEKKEKPSVPQRQQYRIPKTPKVSGTGWK